VGQEFGKLLRQLRLGKDVTLQDVADATGVSMSLLSRIEHGKRNTTPDTVRALAQYFEVPVSELVTAAASSQMRERWGSETQNFSATPLAAADDDFVDSQARMRVSPRQVFMAQPVENLFGAEDELLLESIDEAADSMRRASRRLWTSIDAMEPSAAISAVERLAHVAQEPLEVLRHLASEAAEPAVRKTASAALRRLTR
jgi:transcriptional regulator with XRE-family HTH domain